jgi:hypothetical protein
MVSITPEGIGATVSAGADKLWFYTSALLIVVAVIAGLWWWNRYKSYNWNVIIKRRIGDTDGFALDLGYRGKHFWKNDKEMRFEIYNAKKFKVQYNNEPIDRKYAIETFIKGKRVPTVILEADSENILHPVLLTSKVKQQLEADMSNADITFAASEMENLAQKYLEKPMLEKYGFILFALMLLGAGALYWYGAKENAKAVESMASAVNTMAGANSHIATLLEKALGNVTTAAPAPIPVG